MKTIRIKINNGVDRDNMTLALAHAGNRVWVEEEKERSFVNGISFFVCFDIEDNEVSKST